MTGLLLMLLHTQTEQNSKAFKPVADMQYSHTYPHKLGHLCTKQALQAVWINSHGDGTSAMHTGGLYMPHRPWCGHTKWMSHLMIVVQVGQLGICFPAILPGPHYIQLSAHTHTHACTHTQTNKQTKKQTHMHTKSYEASSHAEL